MKQAALILTAVAVLGVAALMADTTIYVTGNCLVSVLATPFPSPTPTPTAAPFAPTATPTRATTPTPTPKGTVQYSPISPAVAAGLTQILTIMAARFPIYDNTGALIPFTTATQGSYYSFGAGESVVVKALQAGQSPVQIAAALGGIWSRYPTVAVPPGPGGPGGTSYATAWVLAIGESAFSQDMAVLFPAVNPTATPRGTPTPAPTAGAGPGVG